MLRVKASIYSIIFTKNGESFKLSQKNLIQQPEGKSIIAGITSDFHLTNESFLYEKLLLKLNFFGLIMIEVKKTEKDV